MTEGSWSAFCELDPRDQKRIAVYFKYNQELKDAIKKELDGRFVNKDKSPTGQAFWTVALDLSVARRLREIVGPGLTLGQGIEAWGRDEKRAQRQLRSLSRASDAKLDRVPTDAAAWLRAYQRADVKHMSLEDVINANQPGTGKTVETIYAIIESGEPGPHIVVCPTTLFKDPWRDELATHMPDMRVMYGDSPAERRGAINFTWMEQTQRKGGAENIVLLLNPEMIRVEKISVKDNQKVDKRPEVIEAEIAGRKILSKDHKGNIYVPKGGPDSADSLLFEIEGGWIVTDEFHKHGLGADRNTQFARGLGALRKNFERAAALSGTPTGGKPIRLWGPLNFLRPDKFPGKWKWAKLWLSNADGTGPVDPEDPGSGIGGIMPGREEEFYTAHSNHLIRRTRREALPGMPIKQVIDVLVDMTPKQRKAYDTFMRSAEVEIDGGRVTADGVLAEYARAKQFANAMCEFRDGDIHPTRESGKIPMLLDRLDTFGIRKTDPEPSARAIVASESRRFVVLLERVLAEAGLNVRRLDGTVKNLKTHKDRDDVIDWYKDVTSQAGKSEARVLVMTTATGGVGLNLGMTGSIHIMDETWNPDDQEQLEDRGERDRATPLIVVYYRTKDSIQEYIQQVGLNKVKQNNKVLADNLRQAMRARPLGR